MSRVTFNRNRVKLKKLLGIRTRLALLALMLVAPLMLERVRSLEDTRSKQIAQASEEFLNIAQHSADTQREVVSSVETMLKSTAYIRASGGIGAQLRNPARQPAEQPALDPQHHDRRPSDGRVQCSTLNMSGRAQTSATANISRRRRQPATSFSATSCSAGPTTGR